MRIDLGKVLQYPKLRDAENFHGKFRAEYSLAAGSYGTVQWAANGPIAE
jgi:hypothetical protein